MMTSKFFVRNLVENEQKNEMHDWKDNFFVNAP